MTGRVEPGPSQPRQLTHVFGHGLDGCPGLGRPVLRQREIVLVEVEPGHPVAALGKLHRVPPGGAGDVQHLIPAPQAERRRSDPDPAEPGLPSG